MSSRSIYVRALRPYLMLSVVTLSLSLFLTGCDMFNVDTKTQQNANATDDSATLNADTQGYCQNTALPFAYNLCRVSQAQLSSDPNATGLHLKLFWRSQQAHNLTDDTDTHHSDLLPLYRFEALKEDLPHDDSLIFAVNAGMYNTEFAPIGYTVIQGKQIRSLNLKEGGGNFHLLPNGVLWWNKNGDVSITESQALNTKLENNEITPWYATQSGPMLVIDGKIHPKFNQDSTSLKFRNGVGVCADGDIKFVNSDEPVNFYQFASLFKDTLNCPNALFLDGGVASALYAPEINIEDSRNMGVMLGLVENK